MGKWDKIAVKNMGANRQPVDIKLISRYHRFICNCCSKGVY